MSLWQPAVTIAAIASISKYAFIELFGWIVNLNQLPGWRNSAHHNGVWIVAVSADAPTKDDEGNRRQNQ
jgi:hypothetical protein